MLTTELKTCYPSQPFVVLTVDQLVGHGGGPLERQRQDNHVYRKTGTLPMTFRKKSESSLHERRILRNCEKGMAFLTCDGCEDEYNK